MRCKASISRVELFITITITMIVYTGASLHARLRTMLEGNDRGRRERFRDCKNLGVGLTNPLLSSVLKTCHPGALTSVES